MIEEKDCPECGGEGVLIFEAGYRQYGSGYGDCEQLFEERLCEDCEGRGVIDVEVKVEQLYYHPEGDVPF